MDLYKRRTQRHLMRLLLLLFVAIFWFQLHVSHQKAFIKNEAHDGTTLVQTLYMRFIPHKSNLMDRNSNLSLPVITASQGVDVDYIKSKIKAYNEAATSASIDFSSYMVNITLVIAIQVHTRVNYLRSLIVSLAKARDIDKCLLIFSHDYYDEEINNIVQGIDFTKAIQIFYPYSIQIYPNDFPGDSLSDCPRNFKKGREGRFTQTKHHWWWKANVIFDWLPITKKYQRSVLFLEEDHYVSEDFLYMLHGMEVARDNRCPACSILTLGSYAHNFAYEIKGRVVEMGPWISSKHNMGMAFNRSVWNGLKGCLSHFCKRDDYNWDWSLQHVGLTCLKSRLMVLVVGAPRVFHIGECGVHHRKKNCDSSPVLSKVEKALVKGKPFLFPKSLIIRNSPLKKTKKLKENGGWGDHRDHQLCQNITSNPFGALST